MDYDSGVSVPTLIKPTIMSLVYEWGERWCDIFLRRASVEGRSELSLEILFVKAASRILFEV